MRRGEGILHSVLSRWVRDYIGLYVGNDISSLLCEYIHISRAAFRFRFRHIFITELWESIETF